MSDTERVERLLERLGRRDGVRVYRAPGRVNIIGEHIDYAGGPVLPFACDLDLLLAAAQGGERVQVASLEVPGDVDLSLSGDPVSAEGWGRYAAGVALALRERGVEPRGFAGALHSTIPVGAGLSSSAAIEAALAMAMLGGERPAADVLQRAEHLAVGVPCGPMDQVAVLHGLAGHAILLDCSTGVWEHVPIPGSLAFVIVDTGTRRMLDDGRYAQRRRELEGGDPRRARHVTSEIERVGAAVSALRAGDLGALGALIDASHESLRTDFEVSAPSLDAAVAAARSQESCLGARLVGAGFAGCVLCAVRAGEEDRVIARVHELVAGARAFVVRSVDGAGEVPVSGPA